jgi:hypothetical protein
VEKEYSDAFTEHVQDDLPMPRAVALRVVRPGVGSAVAG